MWIIANDDCLNTLKTMPDNSIDSVVTDPPYELGFMGKKWDASGIAYSADLWAEALRVLKPGGHLLAFGGTRTYHRMTCAIEDAGFEIRDSLHWIYGSGFPKSLNVSKAIDNLGELSRELSRDETAFCKWMQNESGLSVSEVKRVTGSARFITGVVEIVNTATKEAPVMGRRAMVPTTAAWEKLLPHMSMQPPEWVSDLVKDPPKPPSLADWTPGKCRGTIGNNEWDGWGTALKPAHEPIVMARKPLHSKTVAANVLEYGTGGINVDGCRVESGDKPKTWETPRGGIWATDSDAKAELVDSTQGRWPPNILLSNEAVEEMDGASRFFPCFKYNAKASKSERPVVDGIAHPTVKPLALIRWLVRLVTPVGGTVLDMFAGTGPVAEACELEGFDSVLIERESDYIKLINARMAKYESRAA